jgi:hypothetical protein
MGEVGSLSATTLENNEKFRLRDQTENELCREVGGGTGTGVEQSLAAEAAGRSKLALPVLNSRIGDAIVFI